MISVELSPGVTVLPAGQVAAFHRQAKQLDLPVYVLETDRNHDREAFFDAVRRVLPLDPPLESSRSWDALADSLWEGLETLGQKRAVILWVDAYEMQSRSPMDYEMAIAILADVSKSLQSSTVPSGDRTEVCIYLAGAA